jgi:uncharacterized protein YjbI with pentapeptide repeats
MVSPHLEAERDRFPLSDSAKRFIRQSIKQRRWNRLKIASWLIIPAFIVVGVVEYNLREASVKADFARLGQEGTYEEKRAAEALVQGCVAQNQMGWLPSYLAERLFGNCRYLRQAPLAKADLAGANLNYAQLFDANLNNANLEHATLWGADLTGADITKVNLNNADLRNAKLDSANLTDTKLKEADLRSVNLSDANLWGADLQDATLAYANLRNAKLIGADLSSANLIRAKLESANLSSAILLSTDLSNSIGLDLYQLTGSDPPFICATTLPDAMKDLSDRDCDRLPQELLERYPSNFATLDLAKQWVEFWRKNNPR